MNDTGMSDRQTMIATAVALVVLMVVIALAIVRS